MKAIYDQHGEDILREGIKDFATGGKFIVFSFFKILKEAISIRATAMRFSKSTSLNTTLSMRLLIKRGKTYKEVFSATPLEGKMRTK